MNLILMQGGFPPIIIPVEARAEYYQALNTANGGDLRPFIRFIARQADSTLQVLKKKFFFHIFCLFRISLLIFVVKFYILTYIIVRFLIYYFLFLFLFQNLLLLFFKTIADVYKCRFNLRCFNFYL